MSAASVALDDAAIDRLYKLLRPIGPSGFEAPAGAAFDEVARELGAHTVTVDASGNHVARFGREGATVRRMLTGHLDEIGFLITRIESSGLLRFGPIGGWDRTVPVGHRVRIVASGPEADTHDGAHCTGVVSRAAIHLQTAAQRSSSPAYEDLWIDIGVANDQQARNIVRIGDPMVIDTPIHLYPTRRITARALDDRICVFACLEAAARAAQHDVDAEYVVLGARTEEIGGFGAMAGTFGIAPGEAIAVDVEPASDVPGTHECDVELGKGPVIALGAVLSRRVGRALIGTAESLDMSIQLTAVGTNTSTDSEGVVSAGPGVATGLVGIPTRNLHMPGEICDLGDVEQTISLLEHWLARPA